MGDWGMHIQWAAQPSAGLSPSAWACPNKPPCGHSAFVHDVEDMSDANPMCCVEGCSCGKPSTSDGGGGR